MTNVFPAAQYVLNATFLRFIAPNVLKEELWLEPIIQLIKHVIAILVLVMLKLELDVLIILAVILIHFVQLVC